jgi:starch synthase
MAGRVLSVASECVPLVKTGGLADVVGALPGALAPHGWDMRVLIPAYRGLAAKVACATEVWSDAAFFGGPARVMAGDVAGMRVLLLDAPHLFDRAGGPYGHQGVDFFDNPERFAALAWAASAIARHGLADGWRPDVLHCHDWQAGFAPAYLRFGGPTDVGSVLTVHNIAFQGHASPDRLGRLRLPAHEFHAGSLEYYGNLSSLKAGLIHADRITTVSPTYADELMRPEFGMGLQGVIAARADVVSGILNGVDTDVWNPEAEAVPYSAKAPKNKALARAALIAEMGLGAIPGPLAIVVSRLTDQKGIDLLPAAIPDFVGLGGGLAILGAGDARLESAVQALARSYPGRVAVRIGYDEGLSHRMFAGADAVLVPSRFEPCGLTQMYGLRYGTIPVVAATGGLADTVVTANPMALASGAATGITFHPTDALALTQALRRLAALHADRKAWAQMRDTAMAAPVGWESSSAAYARLYEGLVP